MIRKLSWLVSLCLSLFVVACGSDDGSGNDSGANSFKPEGLYGSVVDVSTGDGIPDAQIVLFDAEGKCFAATSDSKGRFSFGKNSLAAGNYRAYVTAPGFAAIPHKYSLPPVISYGGSDEKFDFSLAPLVLPENLSELGTIKVSVKDKLNEEPSACVFITAESHGDFSAGFCITNSKGTCSIYNLSEGSYAVRGYFPGITVVRGNDLSLDAGAELPFDTSSMSGYTGSIEVSYSFKDPLSPKDIETYLFFPRILIPMPWFVQTVPAEGSATFEGVPVGTFVVLPKPGSDALYVDEREDFYKAYAQVKRDEITAAEVPITFGLKVVSPSADSVVAMPSKDAPLEMVWDDMPGVDVFGIEIRNPFTGRNVVGGFGNKNAPYTSSESPSYTFRPEEATDSLLPGLYQIIITAMKRNQNGTYTKLWQSESDSGFFVVK